jgi:hypothetical protein
VPRDEGCGKNWQLELVEEDYWQTGIFGLRWQSAAATAPLRRNCAVARCQSGVALRLPPQSKIPHFEYTPW